MPVSTLSCVRTSMYLRNLAATSSPACARSMASTSLSEATSRAQKIAGLKQREHHEDESQHGEADEIIDAAGDGLEQADQPPHVEAL